MTTPAAPVAGEPKAGETPAPASTPAAGPTTWRSSYEDADVKGSASLDKFKGANERELLGHVAKAYVNLEKMPRGLAVPKDDAKPEEWAAFYDKLGRPKSADEYGLDIKVPEGMPWSKQAEANILKHLHEAGLSKRQAEKVVNGYLEEAKKGEIFLAQDKAKSRGEAEIAMKTEWGGLYDLNVALVQRSVGEFGGDEFREYLDSTGLGNDPRFMRFVHKMASPMLEANLIQGDGLGVNRADAKAQIDSIMASEEYQGKKGRPAQQAAVARIQELMHIAHGE